MSERSTGSSPPRAASLILVTGTSTLRKVVRSTIPIPFLLFYLLVGLASVYICVSIYCHVNSKTCKEQCKCTGFTYFPTKHSTMTTEQSSITISLAWADFSSNKRAV